MWIRFLLRYLAWIGVRQHFCARLNGEDQPLFDRLVSVKDRLRPIIASLDEAITQRAAQMTDALSAAVAGWVTGTLLGVEREGDGRPTLRTERSTEGEELQKKISPFREVVGQLISVLPDRGLVAAVKKGLSQFSSRLNAAEQAEAQELERNLALLEQQRRNERE